MVEHHSKPRSQRQLQVGEELRHALSDIFLREDIYGPKGEHISITISEVRISADLHNATVFYMPLGGKPEEKQHLSDLLAVMAPKIRAMIGRKVRMRHLPELYFKLDEIYDNAARMNDLLNAQDPKLSN